MSYLRMIRTCVALMAACYEFADAKLNKRIVLDAMRECLNDMQKIIVDMQKE